MIFLVEAALVEGFFYLKKGIRVFPVEKNS